MSVVHMFEFLLKLTIDSEVVGCLVGFQFGQSYVALKKLQRKKWWNVYIVQRAIILGLLTILQDFLNVCSNILGQPLKIGLSLTTAILIRFRITVHFENYWGKNKEGVFLLVSLCTVKFFIKILNNFWTFSTNYYRFT